MLSSAQQHPADRVACGAFTVLELLLTLVLAFVLLAAIVPTAGRLRAKARELQCAQNARNIGYFIVLYSQDFKSYYPTLVTDGPEVALNQKWWTAYTLQGARLFNSRRWQNYIGADANQPIYRCPANLEFKAIGGKSRFDYCGNNAMYADPGYLNPALPEESWRSQFGGRAQMLDTVLFPSAKVGLFELFVWHGWKGSYSSSGTWSARRLSMFNSSAGASMWFFDGSVASLPFSKANPGVNRSPYWYSAPIWLTANGARGRDR